MKKFKTVALLGRSTGLSILRDSLLPHPLLDVVQVFTHRNLTKAEGGGERPELSEFQSVTNRANIELTILDLPEARRFESFLTHQTFDLLIVLSWKYIISVNALNRVNVAAINLHRGELTKYAGLTPVRRALEAGERRVAITAHKMIEQVDMGEEIARLWIDVPMIGGTTNIDVATRQIKLQLEPLYAPLASLAINSVIAGSSLEKLKKVTD